MDVNRKVARRYRAIVRSAVRLVTALSAGSSDAVYVPRASGDLEPMLALWPSVLAMPITIPIKPADLIALRAFPVHPLGVVRVRCARHENPAQAGDRFLSRPRAERRHDRRAR